MERLSEERYPALGEEQFDFNRALIGMLNCRRYLESQGFTELRESGNGESYAKIVFPDGYSLETEDFARASQTSSRSDLLENMIKNNAIIIPLATYGKNNSRKQVLHSSHLRDDYYVQICIEDTARRHPNIFKRKSCEAKLFSTNYFSRLRKDLITRKDIKEFERIQQIRRCNKTRYNCNAFFRNCLSKTIKPKCGNR